MLSEERIERICIACYGPNADLGFHVAFARAIEREARQQALEAVERECVPPNFVADPASHHYDYDAGYNYCRAEMLRRLAEMRK